MLTFTVDPEAIDGLIQQFADAVAARLRAELMAKCGPEIPAEKLAFSPPEAAKALSISERLLFDLTKSGKIRATKAGARTIYCREALLTYLNT